MSAKFVSQRNIAFCVYEVFDVESLTQHSYFQNHTRETLDLVMDTALKMGKNLLQPYLREMDKNPPEFLDGRVKVHPIMREIMKAFGEGGWIAARSPHYLGGQQLPELITTALIFIFCAANYSASTFFMLTAAAARLIQSFGSQDLIETYIPKMFSGLWQGTMAITEPQAGSSLGDITTKAEPTNQGYYKIRGQKIFISAGDHDAVENVIHLLLAKIPGAPSGVKGISLFLVPKKRISEHGRLESNDVNVTGIYHKLGYRGNPITQLSFGENDDCHGYIVGEPHHGLSYMFQMVNEARIWAGTGAAAIASAAYHEALEYATKRPQGRRFHEKDPASPPVSIINHPDVKRMLLFQRSIVEGSLSLLLQCSKYSDLLNVLEGEKKENVSLLLNLLTPVVKTYPAEMGIHSVSQGLQCLGGYGYCDEFPLEQLYRDARVHPIHDGTTGIQALDLLGRKILMKNGKAFSLYLQEVGCAINAGLVDSTLRPYAKRLQEALKKLHNITSHLTQYALKEDPEMFLADATLYLELFGIISIAWQWLLQGLCANRALQKNPSEGDAQFYLGKLFAFRYFFHYELPKSEGLIMRLKESDGLSVEMKEEYFAD